jgi:hypothetical protein
MKNPITELLADDADDILSRISVDTALKLPAQQKATPHCQCLDAFKYNGRKGQSNFSTLIETKSADGETCDFCGYYVLLQVPKLKTGA